MVFIFVNEALSVILRSVHSVVNHTPSQLLKEVILVDDSSDNGEWGPRPKGGNIEHTALELWTSSQGVLTLWLPQPMASKLEAIVLAC